MQWCIKFRLGAYMTDQNTGGKWSVNEVTYHINIKEMVAVKFALKSFVKEFSDVSIKIFIDNTTVISVLKNMGTSHNFHLTLFVNKYGNGAKTEIFGYSLFILIQNKFGR